MINAYADIYIKQEQYLEKNKRELTLHQLVIRRPVSSFKGTSSGQNLLELRWTILD